MRPSYRCRSAIPQSSAPVAARAVTRREDFELESGDVVVLGGEDRLALHGIDRVLAGTSDLLPEGGRINLTLRRVTKPG